MADTCETCVKLRKRLDDELDKSFCFQMDIRLALGCPDDGVPFDKAVKKLVADNERLRSPDFFWEVDNEEYPVYDPGDVADQTWPNAAILQGAKQLDYDVYLAPDPNDDDGPNELKHVGRFAKLADAKDAAAKAEDEQAEAATPTETDDADSNDTSQQP